MRSAFAQVAAWSAAVLATFASQGGGMDAAALAAKYPDADAVVLDETEEVSYRPDGTYDSVEETHIAILTEKGRREESVISVTYNARYGKAGISEVAVVDVEGVRRTVDVSATTNETTDDSSAASNIYDPKHRKIVCTVPGLKVGDTLVYKTYRKAEKARVENLFSDFTVMEWRIPVVKRTYRVMAPAELPLKKTALRDPLGNVEYTSRPLEGGGTLHQWTARESPQAFAEPDMPPLYSCVQRVIVSTAEDWPQISRWYWELCKPHLAKTTPAMADVVASLDPGAGASLAERITPIFKWVSQEVRYMGLTMEDVSPGYAPHDVDITFDNRYGVCRDKAALLAAMLRMAGIEAYPVMIHVGMRMDPDVATPFFNHAITAVRAPGDAAADAGGFILMDPTNEASADLFPAYLGNRSYLVATPEGEPLHFSATAPPERNALSVSSRGTLERDGSLALQATVEFKGLNDSAYRGALLRRKPSERRRFFERAVKSAAPGAELVSFELQPTDLRDTSAPLAAKLFFRVDGVMLKGETRDELSVPFLSRVLGVQSWRFSGNTALEKRRFPLVLDSTAASTDELEIDLGEWADAAPSLPEPAGAAGDCSFSRSYRVENGRLFASRAVKTGAVEIPSCSYAALRCTLEKIEAADRRRPVFAANRDADSPFRYEKMAAIYNVFSPDSWVVTNIVRKRILDYEGKKKSSELKMYFNPSWKTVEVVSARVTTVDGRQIAAGERETTLLDCGWAAAAPRYPASRQLVVSLPSVEIGSVIEYVTATIVTNSPLPFRAVWKFDSVEPADEISVEYRDWTGREWSRVEKGASRVPTEPMQAPGELWRDVEAVSFGDFAVMAKKLVAAAAVDACSTDGTRSLVEAASAAQTFEDKVKTVRDWMAKNVRVSGPGLYELPLDLQLTAPCEVLESRYATRLDYVRTMCALMKAAGLDADIVFAADDAVAPPELDRFELKEKPDVSRYDAALCRVRERRGGFLGLGGETATFYTGTENEYTAAGEVPYRGCRYMDPAAGEWLSRIETPRGDEETTSISVSAEADASATVSYERDVAGPAAGAFRKSYAEMLPEERRRHHRSLLASIDRAAVPAGELRIETDPGAHIAFEARVPDYATVEGDVMTVRLPGIGGNIFNMTGPARSTPVLIPGRDGCETTVATIVFPSGYDTIERMPRDFSATSPDGGELLYELKFSSSTNAAGRLSVSAVERIPAHSAAMLSPDRAALVKEWTRVAASRGMRTVSARKGKAP